MIRKSDSKKKVEEGTKNSKIRRLLRKKEAEKHNKMYVPFSLDPNIYEWDKTHKKCLGRGYLGINVITKKFIPCSCLKKKKEK